MARFEEKFSLWRAILAEHFRKDKIMFSLHGVHVPHRKSTAEKSAVRMAPPARVVLPMSMHIGRPAEVQVRVGDTVFVGTMKIGRAHV